MSFKGIQAGDRVTCKVHAGIGRHGPETTELTGKANALLIFEHHVVINIGGKHGTPQVVDKGNYVRHRRPKRSK